MYSREERERERERGPPSERGECASIAVAAFCRIVLWFEKKSCGGIAGRMDVARRQCRQCSSHHLGSIQLFGLRVGGDYSVRPSVHLHSTSSVVSLFHMPKEVPTSRSGRFPREKERPTESERCREALLVPFQIFKIYHFSTSVCHFSGGINLRDIPVYYFFRGCHCQDHVELPSGIGVFRIKH